jgi:IstB-like ATP binding protein/Integrase core domain
LHRFALEVLGVGRSARGSTVRVADGVPGSELQVDFGKMGLVFDPTTGRRRVCWALIFTACYSRHCFVWLSFSQTLETVIEGFERAWAFFGGVFRVVIPDNMATVVTKADRLEPRLNQAFTEYAQARGFVIDPARVRTPTDKPRVGVGKTFMASALGHAAVRPALHRGLRAHRYPAQAPPGLTPRQQPRRRARKLIRVDLLILDDFALQALDPLDTADIYELIVERHRAASTLVTPNSEPIEWLAQMADALLA